MKIQLTWGESHNDEQWDRPEPLCGEWDFVCPLVCALLKSDDESCRDQLTDHIALKDEADVS